MTPVPQTRHAYYRVRVIALAKPSVNDAGLVQQLRNYDNFAAASVGNDGEPRQPILWDRTALLVTMKNFSALHPDYFLIVTTTSERDVLLPVQWYFYKGGYIPANIIEYNGASFVDYLSKPNPNLNDLPADDEWELRTKQSNHSMSKEKFWVMEVVKSPIKQLLKRIFPVDETVLIEVWNAGHEDKFVAPMRREHLLYWLTSKITPPSNPQPSIG